MREFERTEVMREKCHICGCKNKLYTNIVTKSGKIVGYTLRCCNCGRTIKYMDPNINIVCQATYVGSRKCIQESYCPHKNCPLYGTCGRHKKKPPKDNKNNGGNKKCNCDCNNCELCQSDFQYQNELTVKVDKESKFL